VHLREQPAVEQAHAGDAVVAREQLLRDGVAVIVCEHAIARRTFACEQRLEQIRLREDRIRKLARLRRQPEADHVEREHAEPRGQPIPDRRIVPRRRRESVDEQQHVAGPAGAEEDLMAAPVEEPTTGLPFVDGDHCISARLFLMAASRPGSLIGSTPGACVH
jgi:hypothetical protein